MPPYTGYTRSFADKLADFLLGLSGQVGSYGTYLESSEQEEEKRRKSRFEEEESRGRLGLQRQQVTSLEEDRQEKRRLAQQKMLEDQRQAAEKERIGGLRRGAYGKLLAGRGDLSTLTPDEIAEGLGDLKSDSPIARFLLPQPKEAKRDIRGAPGEGFYEFGATGGPTELMAPREKPEKPTEYGGKRAHAIDMLRREGIEPDEAQIATKIDQLGEERQTRVSIAPEAWKLGMLPGAKGGRTPAQERVTQEAEAAAEVGKPLGVEERQMVQSLQMASETATKMVPLMSHPDVVAWSGPLLGTKAETRADIARHLRVPVPSAVAQYQTLTIDFMQMVNKAVNGARASDLDMEFTERKAALLNTPPNEAPIRHREMIDLGRRAMLRWAEKMPNSPERRALLQQATELQDVLKQFGGGQAPPPGLHR